MDNYNGITRETILERFDFIDGLFYYKYSTTNRVKAGQVAGYINQGRRRIQIQGKRLLVSRMAFLCYHGWLPPFVDHIDRNTLNDKESNLRAVTRTQNNMNTSSAKGSSSKYLGVCWDKSKNKWLAGIKINGRRKHLGRFNNEEEAALAYNKGATEYFGEFASLNKVAV